MAFVCGTTIPDPWTVEWAHAYPPSSGDSSGQGLVVSPNTGISYTMGYFQNTLQIGNLPPLTSSGLVSNWLPVFLCLEQPVSHVTLLHTLSTERHADNKVGTRWHAPQGGALRLPSFRRCRIPLQGCAHQGRCLFVRNWNAIRCVEMHMFAHRL